jgi:hypothetical protein
VEIVDNILKLEIAVAEVPHLYFRLETKVELEEWKRDLNMFAQ